MDETIIKLKKLKLQAAVMFAHQGVLQLKISSMRHPKP